MVTCGCYASTHHYYTINQLCCYGHGMPGVLTKFGKSFAGSLNIAGTGSIGYFANLLGLKFMVIVAGFLCIDALYGSYSYSFLRYDAIFGLMR